VCIEQDGTPPQDWRLDERIRLRAKLFPHPAFMPEAFPSLDSYQQRLRRREELYDWIVQQEFDFHVTLQFGDTLTEIQVDRALRRFAALVDRHFLGGRWSKFPANARTLFIGAVEEGPQHGHSHVHLLLKLPPSIFVPMGERRIELGRVMTETFTALGRKKGVCSKGDVRFDALDEEDIEAAGAAAYVLKDFASSGRDFVLIAYN
jgi:hypothetical protein